MPCSCGHGIPAGPRLTRLVVLVLLIGGPILATGCGSGQLDRVAILPVKEWIIEIATATGEWVKGHASTFATAIQRAWRGVFPDVVDNVDVDPANPLKGHYRSELRVWVSDHRGAQSGELKLKLWRPSMIRTSSESKEWNIDPEQLPK